MAFDINLAEVRNSVLGQDFVEPAGLNLHRAMRRAIARCYFPIERRPDRLVRHPEFHFPVLVGHSDIRDYNQYTWTNTINDTTTKEVFSNGAGQRLDMQSYALPGAFASETLTSIVLDDTGANNFQRILVAGLTVKTIPAPGLAGMSLIGAVTLAGRRRR